MASSDVESRLAELRAISQSRELTTEEAREALQLIRGDRVAAGYASKASKSKSTVAKASPADVLEKLKAMMGEKKS